MIKSQQQQARRSRLYSQRHANERKPLPGQSKLQMGCALRNRHPCRRSKQLQLPGALQLFVLRLRLAIAASPFLSRR